MATTATLTGTFTLPNNAAPDSAVLSVTLSAMDTDQNTGHVLPDDGLFTVALVAGEIPAGQTIWQNTAGLRGTHYRATLAWTASDGRLLSRYLGSFQVGDDASYDMADLLDQPPIATLPEGWYSTLTQAQYDAAFAARDEAVAAAGQAAEQVTAVVVAGEAIVDAAAAERAAAELAVTNAQAAAMTVATWTALSALTASVAGTGAEVLDTDTGTHTDPVVGGTVNNAGRYSWSASPAGWRRIGDTGLSAKVAKVEAKAERKAGPRTLDSTGKAWLATRADADGEILWGVDLDSKTWSMVDGALQRVAPYQDPYRPSYEFVPDPTFPFVGPTGFGLPDEDTWIMLLDIDQSYGVGQAAVAGYDVIATPTALDTNSWQIGKWAYPYYSPEADNYNTLEPLAGKTRTTYSVTAAHYIQHHLKAIPTIGREHPIIATAAALGGKTIAELRPGTQVFENAIYLMHTANRLVAEQGGRLEIHFVCMQGPADAKQLTPFETYQDRFLDVVSALRKAAKDITGQARPSYMFVTATDEFKGTDPNFAAHEVACAQTEMHRRDPFIRFAGPLYQYERQENVTPDRIHPSAKAGFVQLGETIGHAITNSLFYPAVPAYKIRRAWWAAGVAHAWPDLIVEYTSPTTIDLTGVQVDYATLGAGRGFDVTDGPAGTPVTIESVTVEANACRLRVTFAADPSTMRAPWLQVAHTRTPGMAPYDEHTGPLYGARSVIRETAPIALGTSDGSGAYVSKAVNLDGSPLGQNVYRWAPPQSIQLERA